MLNRLADRVLALASWRKLGLLLLAYVACLVPLSTADAQITKMSGGLGVPDLLHGFTAADLYARFEAFGEAGRSLYFRAELVDLIYPIIYGFFFAFLIALGARRFLRAESPWRLLCLVPLGTTLLDYLENACFFTVLLSWPARLDTVASLAAVFNVSKWLAFVVVMPTAIVSLIALVVAAIRRAPNPTS